MLLFCLLYRSPRLGYGENFLGMLMYKQMIISICQVLILRWERSVRGRAGLWSQGQWSEGYGYFRYVPSSHSIYLGEGPYCIGTLELSEYFSAPLGISDNTCLRYLPTFTSPDQNIYQP